MLELTAALTPRERQIIALVVDGCSNSEIAARLGLSAQTVKNQISVIFDKVGATSRVQLAVFAVRQELVPNHTPSGIAKKVGTFGLLEPRTVVTELSTSA